MFPSVVWSLLSKMGCTMCVYVKCIELKKRPSLQNVQVRVFLLYDLFHGMAKSSSISLLWWLFAIAKIFAHVVLFFRILSHTGYFVIWIVAFHKFYFVSPVIYILCMHWSNFETFSEGRTICFGKQAKQKIGNMYAESEVPETPNGKSPK